MVFAKNEEEELVKELYFTQEEFNFFVALFKHMMMRYCKVNMDEEVVEDVKKDANYDADTE